MTEEGLAPRRRRLEALLLRPTDIAGLAAFRVVFGLLGLVSMIRILAFGWVQEFFVKPSFFFKYWGFGWVEALPATGMYALLLGLALLSVMIAAGLFYRASVVLFFLGFTYLQLIDVTNYLNHYYLVSLLAFLMIFLPLHRAWSLDAWLRPRIRTAYFSAWQTYILRFQIGVVYFFAGLAKLSSDWLLHAQPLNIWLAARTGVPILGPLFGQRWVAYAMSWAGFLFDTTVVAFLLTRRARPYAFVVLALFHAMTSLLFPIGMFPVIMTTSALIFFSPSWPRRVLRALGVGVAAGEVSAPLPSSPSSPAPRWAPVAVMGVVVYCALQALLPFRHLLYGTGVAWHEQGMRFAWKVMVREKNGSITYHVEDKATGRVREVSPRKYLTDRQEREFSGQPDLILQLGHRIARDFAAKGVDVRVRVEAAVSLNGRPALPMIDPSVDLAQIPEGISPARWILPPPGTPPIHLSPN